ncbi:DUF6843 domain-containing protein [Fervidibacillus albus]|uniref:DUF6843 domain-containing protein n=1 Tax=Fervidibacillus albus TaxID=2980026 RepID=A0A9E8RXS2_9BACI|nr:hypothetical protein [Fervidibacillus albus]WAA09872.1 hypothetical protein OE104_00365 [Fervidibacillus albus]
MKKYLWVFISVGLAFFILLMFIPAYWLFSSEEKISEQNYYLPEGFEGCALIFYNVEGAPPLKLTDEGVINYHFNEDGILFTSSPEDFGWEGKDSSGFYKANYYKGGQLISDEEIVASSLGEAFLTTIGHPVSYLRLSIGYDACHDSYLDKIIRENFEK